jgi:hypothetical protein
MYLIQLVPAFSSQASYMQNAMKYFSWEITHLIPRYAWRCYWLDYHIMAVYRIRSNSLCIPPLLSNRRQLLLPSPKLVCMSGKWNKNVWKGPCRSLTKKYFNRWAENLYLGIMDNNPTATTDADAGDDDDGKDAAAFVTKVQKTIPIQLNGGYQNEFLFAERQRRRR